MSKIVKNKNLLPAGFSDKLYPKSQKQTLIVEKILNFFSKFSYLRISPPLIEFEETLLSEGPGATLKENTFRIMDFRKYTENHRFWIPFCHQFSIILAYLFVTFSASNFA